MRKTPRKSRKNAFEFAQARHRGLEFLMSQHCGQNVAFALKCFSREPFDDLNNQIVDDNRVEPAARLSLSLLPTIHHSPRLSRTAHLEFMRDLQLFSRGVKSFFFLFIVCPRRIFLIFFPPSRVEHKQFTQGPVRNGSSACGRAPHMLFKVIKPTSFSARKTPLAWKATSRRAGRARKSFSITKQQRRKLFIGWEML